MSLPQFIKTGYISQVYFAIVGVILPLSYSFLQSSIAIDGTIFLGFFTSGLVFTFAYIALEIRQAIKK